MKKTLVALAALAATGAFAQSTVTISGRMDAGFTYDSSAAAGAKLKIGRGNNNRINFDVTEDLGGGMAATVAVGMRFEPDLGTPEVAGARPLFQGETRVGLRGNFGHVRFGRGLTAVNVPNGGYDPFGATTVAAMQGYITSFYNSVETAAAAIGTSTALPGGEARVGNGFFYDSPTIGGFGVGFSYSLAEAVSAAFVNDAYSLAFTYNQGPVSAMLGYEVNNAKTKFTQIGASYDMGMAKIMGTWSTQVHDVATGSTGRITGYGIGVNMPMGAAILKAGYARASSDLAGSEAGNQFAVGVQYNLSKRTYLYTDIARENTLAATAAAQVNKTKYDLGIAHAF